VALVSSRVKDGVPGQSAADPGTATADLTTANAHHTIKAHLAVMANASAPEEARTVSREALLTALGGGYGPEVRLRIVRGLLGEVDIAYHSLLAKYLGDIHAESEESGDTKVAEEAARLLKSLEPSEESADQ
jgi:ubiquinone biosynthesis protein UbiJ